MTAAIDLMPFAASNRGYAIITIFTASLFPDKLAAFE
jgi:hypothetical protein